VRLLSIAQPQRSILTVIQANKVTTLPGQAQTSGGYNAAQTPFAVVTKAQILNQGVSMGDWALVTNNATGQQTYARVGDSGPAGGSGEISEAAATAVGIQFTKSSATIGNPSVTVQIYPGTRNIQSM